MTTLTILASEDDGAGGAFIQWHDAIQGVAGYFHLTAASAGDLCRVEGSLGSPHAAGLDDLCLRLSMPLTWTATGKPTAATKTALELWRAAYEAMIADRVDRMKFNIKGTAPHRTLAEARNGRTVPAKHQRNAAGHPAMADFRQRTKANERKVRKADATDA